MKPFTAAIVLGAMLISSLGSTAVLMGFRAEAPPLIQVGTPSTTIYGSHHIELREGVSPEQFESFVSQEFLPAWKNGLGGMRVRVLKGVKGARTNSYSVVWMFDDIHTLNRYYPGGEDGTPSPELYKVLEPIQTTMDTFWFMIRRTEYTDYVKLRCQRSQA